MTCRVASRIVSPLLAPNPFIYDVSSQTSATRLFRRIASKGTTSVPRPDRCGGERDRHTTRRWFVVSGVVVQRSRGGVCRVVWRSGVPATSFFPFTLLTNGDRT
jgi:hypothetical protein